MTSHESMTSLSADVIIVGGGLSGLYAGRSLQAGGRGLRVMVLEARDRVGGRTYTVKGEEVEGGGVWADLGGAYISPSVDHTLMKLIDDLGLDTFPAGETGSAALRPVYHSGGYSRDRLYTNLFERWDLGRLHGRLESMSLEVAPEAPWEAPRAREWDHMTLKEFIDQTVWTGVGRERGYRLADSVFACGAHEVSLLGLLWILRARGGMQSLVGPYGPGERRVEGGSQRVSERLADSLDVRLSSPVVSIDQSDTSRVTIVTSSGTAYHSSYVIIAVPPPIITRISFIPALPPIKLQLFQRLPMGSVIKTVTFYKEPFWRADLGRSGALSTDGFPVTGSLDDTRPEGSGACLTGFISGENARKAASLTRDQRRDLVIKQYAESFHSPKFLHPTLYLEQNWMGEEFSGGCYLSGLMPGLLTTFKGELRRPSGRIHFCGSESARRCVGYMEGALESGERVAGEILEAVGRSSTSPLPGKL